MADRTFTKADFKQGESGYFGVEYKKSDIGEGSNLRVERKMENGDYETVQAEIKRFEDGIFICWSEPFDGRLIFEM